MNKITDFFTSLAQKYLPSAYVFSLLLTLFVFLCGVIFKQKNPLVMIEYWGDGFWNLLSFSMQMTLILLFGFTLAKTKWVHATLTKTAGLATNNTSAVLLVTLVSCLACLLSWGFGLIVSALFALEVAKKVEKVNFGLLIAASYSGFLVWHGGFSGSIPLKLTNPSEEMKTIIESEALPLSQTLFSSMNISIVFMTIFTLLVLNYFFSRDKRNLQANFSVEEKVEKKDSLAPKEGAKKLEDSPLLGLTIGALGMIYALQVLFTGGILSFNLIIFIFLKLGILLHGSPSKFYGSFKTSVEQSAGIILQFPFYAGIMGMMASSGMAQALSEFFVSLASRETFLIYTYISAGIVNFFVPSGGGQWVIQGPIILPAAKELGVSLPKAAMAIAWGDAWSNMVQPFWALPLLSIAKIELKDIMGYLVIIFLATGLVTSAIFALASS